MDVQGKNGFDIRNKQEKSYKNDELFFLGFEKLLKNAGQCNDSAMYDLTFLEVNAFKYAWYIQLIRSGS